MAFLPLFLWLLLPLTISAFCPPPASPCLSQPTPCGGIYPPSLPPFPPPQSPCVAAPMPQAMPCYNRPQQPFLAPQTYPQVQQQMPAQYYQTINPGQYYHTISPYAYQQQQQQGSNPYSAIRINPYQQQNNAYQTGHYYGGNAYQQQTRAGSYQINPYNPYAPRLMPQPQGNVYPIPARENLLGLSTTNEHKSGEEVKNPFEKEPTVVERHPTQQSLSPQYVLPSAAIGPVPPPLPAVPLPQSVVYPAPVPPMPPIVCPPPQMPLPCSAPSFPHQPCAPSFPPAPILPPSLPPMQNCCLRCGRHSCKGRKKAFGSKTISIADEKKKEKRCNDQRMAEFMGQSKHEPMAEAKQTMAERMNDQMAGIFHVFCAPKGLEYMARTEKFCAQEVADGVCFAFRTDS